MRNRHMTTCESALERFNAQVFEKKISSFLEFFFCCIFPLVFGKKSEIEMDLGFLCSI